MKQLALSLLLVGFSLQISSKNTDSLISLVKVVPESKKAGLLEDISIALRFTDTDKSLQYAMDALVAAKAMGDNIEIANSYNCVGIANHIKGNYDIALINYLQALRYFEAANAKKGIASTYLNMGMLYHDQRKYDMSLTYYKDALAIYEAGAGKKKNIADALNNIATVYSSQMKFSLALEYQQKVLKIREELNDSSGISASTMNLGIIYLGMHEIEKSIPFYLKSIEIDRKLGDEINLAISLSNIADVYFQQHDYEKALAYSNECIEISKRNGLKQQLRQAYWVLSDVYKSKKDFENALKYHELYSDTKDSIYSDESAQSIAEMQTKYDTEKKENDNNLLRKESEIKNLQLSKNKIWIIILFLGIGIVALTALFLFNRYRRKKIDNMILATKNNEITQQKKAITDSINYAKRIQNAILPPLKTIKKILPESFIFYKPKDIVSGDFFWVEQKKDEVLFAAVDCTGHGVPGAMMSVLGFNLLSQAVKEKGMSEPASILKHLDIGVNQALRQSSDENAVKDGMDLSICSLNTRTLQLQYAGAYNPLWIIKSGSGELIELKADKKQIGENSDDGTGNFKNNLLQLEKGDCIYIFSDGFADQFGGSAGKKYMYKPMKELFRSISGKPMDDQMKIIEASFLNWQGIHEQVDDVLVIGVCV